MRGDFSVIDKTPFFQGVEDKEDGHKVMSILSKNIKDILFEPDAGKSRIDTPEALCHVVFRGNKKRNLPCLLHPGLCYVMLI
jgi:hypothetical protein